MSTDTLVADAHIHVWKVAIDADIPDDMLPAATEDATAPIKISESTRDG